MSVLKIRDEQGVFQDIPVLQGPKGEDGPQGKGLEIVGTVDTVEQLPTDAPAGTAYYVGTTPPRDVYVKDIVTGNWINQGPIGGTMDYNKLDNIPKINGINLSSDKSSNNLLINLNNIYSTYYCSNQTVPPTLTNNLQFTQEELNRIVDNSVYHIGYNAIENDVLSVYLSYESSGLSINLIDKYNGEQYVYSDKWLKLVDTEWVELETPYQYSDDLNLAGLVDKDIVSKIFNFELTTEKLNLSFFNSYNMANFPSTGTSGSGIIIASSGINVLYKNNNNQFEITLGKALVNGVVRFNVKYLDYSLATSSAPAGYSSPGWYYLENAQYLLITKPDDMIVYSQDIVDYNKTDGIYLLLGTYTFLEDTDIISNYRGSIYNELDIINYNINEINTALDSNSFRVLTQAQYDALTTKDASTIYFITE